MRGQVFNVGPRYFPGVVRVQRLRQSAFVLRLGYIDPAESFAFPLLVVCCYAKRGFSLAVSGVPRHLSKWPMRNSLSGKPSHCFGV